MAFNISYIIEAIDRFSSVSDKVGESVKRMDANIAASGKRLVELQKQVSESGESWKKVADKSKYYSLAAAGAIALSIREWGKQEDAIERVGVALANTKGRLGFSIGDLTAQSEALAKTSLFADEDILENVSGKLLLFKRISKDSFGRAQQDIIDYATYMKVDLATASSVVGRALNSPSKGIRGLRSAGIQLNATQLQTITTLEKTGQVAKAQEIIFKALEDRFKGVGEAATKTSTGQIKMMNKSIGELAESIGKNLVPIILPAIQAINWFVTALANSNGFVKGAVVGILLLVAVISPIAFVVAQLSIAFTALGIVMRALAVINFMTASSFIVVYAPILVIIAALALMGTIVYQVYKHWEQLVAIIKQAVEWVSTLGSEMAGGGMELVKTVSHLFDSKAEVGGRIDVNINDKGKNVSSAKAQSNSGVDLAVGQNMPAGA